MRMENQGTLFRERAGAFLRAVGRRFVSLALAAMLFCLLSAASGPARAAVSQADLSGRGVGYTSVLYDSSSGLPTSEANAIAQSSDGFLWIGSYSGLIRYDGNEFHRYASSSGISSVVCLFVDSQDRLWIGTNDSGAAVLKDETLTFYNRQEGLSSSSVHSIVEDTEGNILIATTMGMAYVDTDGVLHPIDDPQIKKQYICELVLGEDGVVYGETLGGDFFTVEQHRVSAYYRGEDLGFGAINTIYPDPDNPGWVYLGTQGSEVVYGDLSRGMRESVSISVAPQTPVNAIRRLDGLLWICSDNGIGYLDQERRYTRLVDLPMTNSIDHVMEDYEGNLWFTSSRQGVMKIVENRFTDVSRLAGLNSLVVNTTCSYGQDLYVGTDTGLFVLDENLIPKETELSRTLEGVRIRCIRADSRGMLWLCTYSANGLVCYDGASGEIRFYTEASGLASNRVRSMMELSDGTLAVATNAGMNLIRDGEITAVYNNSQGISNMEILCLEEGPDGRIYLGSDGDGIYIVDGSRVSRLGLDDGLKSEVILRMKRDPVEELYWIVTSNSIAYLRGNTITTVQHFPYSNNFDLYFDRNDRIWVLSSNGVYVVKREDMLADAPFEYTLYDTKCGLPCVATANSYSQLDEDGTLYIAGSTGVCSVNIDTDFEDGSEVRLAVPYLMADDEYIAVRGMEKVHVPATCRRLNIYAYAFTYSLSNPHISYYLEGFDQEPMVVTKQELGNISYTNLDGGTYRFHLSSIDISTGKARQTIIVTIVKDEAIYERAWFQILMMLLVVLLVAGVVLFFARKKTRALLRKQAEHKRLIHDMSSVFAKCIDMKDASTNGHSTRVAKYASKLAERLGKSRDEVDEIYNIALLHDIGKISIPDSILNKPGRLSDEEFAVMKSHAQRGYDILRDVTIAPDLALGAGYHHERYDGGGYPSGLHGEEIPEVAQIIAVADTFDAMYSTRPYRKKMELSAVADELRKSAGTQLNPDYVKAFLSLLDEGAFQEIKSN